MEYIQVSKYQLFLNDIISFVITIIQSESINHSLLYCGRLFFFITVRRGHRLPTCRSICWARINSNLINWHRPWYSWWTESCIRGNAWLPSAWGRLDLWSCPPLHPSCLSRRGHHRRYSHRLFPSRCKGLEFIGKRLGCLPGHKIIRVLELNRPRGVLASFFLAYQSRCLIPPKQVDLSTSQAGLLDLALMFALVLAMEPLNLLSLTVTLIFEPIRLLF